VVYLNLIETLTTLKNTLIYMAFKSGGEAVMVVPSTGMMEKFHTCRRISE
jgi:hypothetical protein